MLKKIFYLLFLRTQVLLPYCDKLSIKLQFFPIVFTLLSTKEYFLEDT